MLSGEGNNKRSNQQNSNFARTAHFFCTFLCHWFARLQRETSRNLFDVTRCLEKMSYMFSFTFFALPLIFTLHCWPLAFLLLSPPLQNCHVVLPTKKCLLCFYLSLALDLCRRTYFSFSVFLLLYIPVVDMTINLSLTLQTTLIQKQFQLSVCVFIDLQLSLFSQDSGGYAISRQNNLELHLDCHTC